VTEVDARHLIAFRAVAQDAIRTEKPAAFLYVRRRVAVLCQKRRGIVRTSNRNSRMRSRLSTKTSIYL
jgi:hypothetical protein